MNRQQQHRSGSGIRSGALLAAALAGAFLCGDLHAQDIFPSYSFTAHNGNYTELPSATVITSDWNGGQFLLGVGPRTFTFFGQKVDFGAQGNYMGVLANGELIIVSDTTQFTLPVFLSSLRSKDASSSISHGIFDVTDRGDTAYIIQWKNAGLSDGDPGDYVNFQIWVFKESGVIEYHFGPNRIVGANAFNGSPGPSIGVVVSDRGITSWFEGLFVIGSAENPITGRDGASFFQPLNGVPSPNHVYRFTPTAAVSSVPAADASDSDLRVYPSIVRDRVTIELGDGWGNDATATVRDILGRATDRTRLDGRSGTLDLSGLPAGSYWVEVAAGSRRRVVMIVRQ